MAGGIKAWNGFMAKGAPEAGTAYFSPANTPEELIALAWLLEDGSQKFYSETARIVGEGEAVNLFQELTAAEENHKSALSGVYREISGGKSDPNFPESLIKDAPKEKYIEGGVRLSEALEWIKGNELKDILDFCISLEVNSEDLYIKMERKTEDKRAKQAFKVLSDQEKKHLERLTALLEA